MIGTSVCGNNFEAKGAFGKWFTCAQRNASSTAAVGSNPDGSLMPFGDHPQTRQATVSRADFGPGLHKIPSHPVQVPDAEPPWWWSEYLTDEWKRLNHYKQQPRDARTKWQRSEDSWRAQLCCWEAQDFGTVGNKPGLTRDTHAIWTAIDV